MRQRQVTSVASTWVRQPLWWQDEAIDAQELAPLLDERTDDHLALDELLVLEVFQVPSGAWYLERIIDDDLRALSLLRRHPVALFGA